MEVVAEMVVKYVLLYEIKLLFRLLKYQFPVPVAVQVEQDVVSP